GALAGFDLCGELCPALRGEVPAGLELAGRPLAGLVDLCQRDLLGSRQKRVPPDIFEVLADEVLARSGVAPIETTCSCPLNCHDFPCLSGRPLALSPAAGGRQTGARPCRPRGAT